MSARYGDDVPAKHVPAGTKVDTELPVQVEAANGLRHLIELDGTEVGRRKRTKARRNGRKEEEGEKGRRGRIEG